MNTFLHLFTIFPGIMRREIVSIKKIKANLTKTKGEILVPLKPQSFIKLTTRLHLVHLQALQCYIVFLSL